MQRLKHYGWGREGEGLSAEEEAFVLDRHRHRFGVDSFDERLPPALSDIKLRPPRLAPHLLAGRSGRPAELRLTGIPALPRRDLFRPGPELGSFSPKPRRLHHLHVVVPSTTMGCCLRGRPPLPVVLSS